MVEWFWRRRKRSDAPRLKSRDDGVPAVRADLAEFTPAPIEYFARAAYTQLAIAEDLGLALPSSPSTAAKLALAEASEAVLERYRALSAELATLGDPASAMETQRAAVDRFRRTTAGDEWYERLLTAHLAGGFFADLYVALAAGLAAEVAGRARAAFAERPEEAIVHGLISAGIAADEHLAARMALWGRRILGDALLVARAALDVAAVATDTESRIEPAFSELIANHTRRMDALGLSA